ncbi:hypothetical protein HID58_002705 [Brassica napus]|uniref:Uncharacterized protein n=1 Tax=Brassica napus TaxID=3708 RepID=A0ABQ8ENJ8_BRANA|nr:hypothetical protein HID58_002705 [Brassica napus]
MQPSSSIRHSSSESSSYVHPTSLILHGQMGYTRSKGVDLASAKRLLPVSNFYNANVAFALGRFYLCLVKAIQQFRLIMYFVMVEKSGAEDDFHNGIMEHVLGSSYVSAEILAIVPDPGEMVATRPVNEQY